MVEPTDNKVFRLRRKPRLQEFDVNTRNGIKKRKFEITKISSEADYGEIKIFLKFDIAVKNLIDNKDIINETTGQRSLRMIGNLFDSIRENFECSDLKKNIIKDMTSISKAIVKRIDESVKPQDESKINTNKQQFSNSDTNNVSYQTKTSILSPEITYSEIFREIKEEDKEEKYKEKQDSSSDEEQEEEEEEQEEEQEEEEEEKRKVDILSAQELQNQNFFKNFLKRK